VANDLLIDVKYVNRIFLMTRTLPEFENSHGTVFEQDFSNWETKRQ
jgi:hypothetical protein